MELDHLSNAEAAGLGGAHTNDAPTAGIPGKHRRLKGKDLSIQSKWGIRRSLRAVRIPGKEILARAELDAVWSTPLFRFLVTFRVRLSTFLTESSLLETAGKPIPVRVHPITQSPTGGKNEQ
jgi:hypothetical protein